jgi:hypothetical protein
MLLVCAVIAIAPAAAGSSPPQTPAAQVEGADASPETEPAGADPAAAEVGETPSEEIICVGDSCQPLPSEPEDPTPGTLVPTSGNPPLHIFEPRQHGKTRRKAHHKKHRRGGARRAAGPTR